MKFFLFTMLAIFSAYSGVSQQIIATLSGITTTQVIDDKVFFAANHEGYGTELYVSNGTPGDFKLVKDIYPGYGSSSPMDFIVFNNQLYFTAYLPDLGKTIWSSDGTKEGTKLIYGVKDADPSNLMVFKGHLYFTTNLGSIVRTDGSSANIQVYYQDEYTWGRVSTIVKNEQYIFFTTGGRTIYRDDGFSRISFFGPLSWEDVYFKKLFVLDNKLVVMKSSTYDTVIRLYAINNELLGGGQEEDEWVVIKKLDAPIYGTQKIENFTNVSGKLFFSFRTYFDNVTPTDELWICDGTAEGTNMVKSFGWSPHSSQSEMRMFFAFNGKLFFRGGDPVNRALWTSDGTTEGTKLFHDVILTPLYNDNRVPVLTTEDRIYFSGGDGYTANLWSSDGTTVGTQQILNLEDAESKPPHDFCISNEVLYFITTQQFTSSLWSSKPASDISVSNYWGNLIPSGSKASLFYGVAIGECETREVIIRNIGLKELYIRSIYLTGTDFYLVNQSLQESIAPGEAITIQVLYNPISKDKSQATLTILSNDNNESKYVIYLEATASMIGAGGICQFPLGQYVKRLDAVEMVNPFLLSNSFIQEGQPLGTTIGDFSLETSATFTLVGGEGDTDNVYFFIEDNHLKSNGVFNFDLKNTYSIRVKATTPAGEIESSFRIQVVNNSVGFTEEDDCRTNFDQLSFEYNTLEINTEGHLFSTTNTGYILRSMDEGANWEVVYRNTFSLTDIFFLGNTGYASGSGILLKTEDGGATWFRLYLPLTGEYYNSNYGVFFFNATKGYVGTEEGEIFFTNDGGRKWEPRLKASWLEFRDLFFLSEQEGYATSGWGDFYRTSDGGRTWSEIDLSALGWNTRIRDMWFINDQKGFIVGEYKIYKTTDGGENWSEVSAIPGDGSRIKFMTPAFGYIFGGNGAMYKTNDGGDSWTSIFPGIWPGRISGVVETTGKIHIVNKDYNFGSATNRSFATSVDNGASWTVRNNFQDGDIYALDFTNEPNGILVGESGIFKTNDDGLTWHYNFTDLTYVDDLLSIDDNVFILLSSGNIYRSTDGGATIQNVLTAEQTPQYLPAGKFYRTPGNVIFSSSWYAIYKSEDLGETWELVSVTPENYIQSMHFVSPSIGYRVELFGSVEKTIDGGTSWTEIFTRDIEESIPFSSIFFIDESTGYKGGNVLQRTTDGGVTWEKVNWDFYEIFAIHFENKEHGYVVTRGGYVYETKDTGKTWSWLYSTSNRLRDAQFVNDKIYLVGEYGFIGKISTTPRELSVPGYIYGPTSVCAGDAVEYFVAVPYGNATQWDTSSGNIADRNDRITVSFPDPGAYTISARHLNSCRISETRTLTIQVSEPPLAPIIEGPNPSMLGEQNVEYFVANGQEGSKFLWDVEGSSSIAAIDNSVFVDWSDQAEQGLVNVLEIDPNGCRTYGNFDVELVLPVAVEDDLQRQVMMYPNPTEADTQIASSYNGLLFIRIRDTLGREVSRTTLSGMEEQTLSTQRLSSGLYFVEISNGLHTIVKKLVKE